MIGVICKNSQKSTVEEFFQLFKTPWEFYNGNEQYDVILMTEEYSPLPKSRLFVLFGTTTTNFDICNQIQISPDSEKSMIKVEEYTFPVNNVITFLNSNHHSIVKNEKDVAVGIKMSNPDMHMIRIGYDIFDEIEHLMTTGQETKHASFPTLDIHIDLLKRWMLDAGIQVIEIPPVPDKYLFTVCLTHDVDFIKITDHGLDHSVLGYIVRSIFTGFLRNYKSNITWKKMIKNWKALISLPFVYLGLTKDVWFDIDRYCEIEKDIPSTYFFLPYKEHPGKTKGKRQPRARMMKYDIQDYKPLIKNISSQGREIGLHGLNAWDDDNIGKQEKRVLENLLEGKNVGVRIHWLYFKQESPQLLENAGFLYDSTFGFNDAIGYKAGTSQVFKLPTTKNLLELQLSVMDTSLFYKRRMGVNEPKAMNMINKLIDQCKKFGGVLTINWHTRSLSPERNWDEFYIELINLLKSEHVWFASAHDVIRWFKIRRSIRFKSVSAQDDKISLDFPQIDDTGLPQFQLRVHTPVIKRRIENISQHREQFCKTIPLNRNAESYRLVSHQR